MAIIKNSIQMEKTLQSRYGYPNKTKKAMNTPTRLVSLMVFLFWGICILFPAGASEKSDRRIRNAMEFQDSAVEWIYDDEGGERLGGPVRFGPGIAIPGPLLKTIIHACDSSGILSRDSAIEIQRLADSVAVVLKDAGKCEGHLWPESLEGASPRGSGSFPCSPEPAFPETDLARVRLRRQDDGTQGPSILLRPRVVRAVLASFAHDDDGTSPSPEPEGRLSSRWRDAGSMDLFVQGNRKYLRVHGIHRAVHGFDGGRTLIFDAETMKRLNPPGASSTSAAAEKDIPPEGRRADGSDATMPPAAMGETAGSRGQGATRETTSPALSPLDAADLLAFQDAEDEWAFDYDLQNRMNVMSRPPYRFGPGLHVSGALFQALAEALADSHLPMDDMSAVLRHDARDGAFGITLRSHGVCEERIWNRSGDAVGNGVGRTFRCGGESISGQSLARVELGLAKDPRQIHGDGAETDVVLSPRVLGAIAGVVERMAEGSNAAGCHFPADVRCRADDYELFINGNRRRVRSVAVRRPVAPLENAVDLTGTDVFHQSFQ